MWLFIGVFWVCLFSGIPAMALSMAAAATDSWMAVAWPLLQPLLQPLPCHLAGWAHSPLAPSRIAVEVAGCLPFEVGLGLSRVGLMLLWGGAAMAFLPVLAGSVLAIIGHILDSKAYRRFKRTPP